VLKRVGFDGELTSTILRPDKVARYRYFSTIVSVAVLSFCLKSKLSLPLFSVLLAIFITSILTVAFWLSSSAPIR